MKAPKIDLKELKKIKENNFKERLKFIDQYSEWVKKNQSKKWSSQQNDLLSK